MHWRQKLKVNSYSKKKKMQKIKMFKYCERKGEDLNRMVSE